MALLDDRLQQVLHQQRQVFQQLRGMKVLLHGRYAAAAEIVQAEGLLEASVVRFDAPAAVIEVREHFGREGLSIQQGGQQHFAFTAGQLDPDQAQFNPARRIDASLGTEQARLGMVGREELRVLDLTRAEKLLNLCVVATRQTHQEVPPLLLEQCEEPVPGVAAIKQRQAVSGHMIEVQMGAIALAELDRKSTRLNSSHSQISYAVF